MSDPILVRKVATGTQYRDWNGATQEAARGWNVLAAEQQGRAVGWAVYRRFNSFDNMDEQIAEAVEGPFIQPLGRGRLIYLASVWVEPEARRSGVMQALLAPISAENLPVYGAFRNWWLRTWIQITWALPGAITSPPAAWEFRSRILDAVSGHENAVASVIAKLEAASRKSALRADAERELDQLTRTMGLDVVPLVEFGYGIRIRFEHEGTIVEPSRLLYLDTDSLSRDRPDEAEEVHEKSLEVIELLSGANRLSTTRINGCWRDPLGNEFWAEGAMLAHYLERAGG